MERLGKVEMGEESKMLSLKEEHKLCSKVKHHGKHCQSMDV